MVFDYHLLCSNLLPPPSTNNHHNQPIEKGDGYHPLFEKPVLDQKHQKATKTLHPISENLICTLLKPVNINTLVFDGKTDKFELFEDLFHTMLRMQPDLTEPMKINLFHAHLRKNALQTFRNINTANRQTLEDILVIFRRKYVKPESQATAKHKWHKLTFDPEKMKLPDFLEELNQGAEKAFGENAQHMIDSLL